MNREEIVQYIEKINQSPQFIKSPTNQALLRFLVDCTLSNTVPKEYVIAKEVFGKDANDNFNVRVYISNLRKKLAEYYQNDGANDEFQFQVPKGQYSVEFVEKASLVKRHKQVSLTRIVFSRWMFLFFGVMITVLSFLVIEWNPSIENKLKKSIVWNGFFEAEKPSYIVLADHYFFTGRFLGKESLFMRTPIVNSNEAMNEYIQQFPELEEKLEKTERTYLSPQSVSCLYNVLPVFCKNNVQTELRLSSTLSWSDLPDHNFLFIGSYRAIGIFEEFLEKAGVKFDNKTSDLEFAAADSNYQYHFGKSYLLEDDYVTVLRLKTESGTEILFFLSSFEIGNDAITKFFVNEDHLGEFEKKIPNNMESFKALFKVSGLYTTTFKSELLHIDAIENKELLKWP